MGPGGGAVCGGGRELPAAAGRRAGRPRLGDAGRFGPVLARARDRAHPLQLLPRSQGPPGREPHSRGRPRAVHKRNSAVPLLRARVGWWPRLVAPQGHALLARTLWRPRQPRGSSRARRRPPFARGLPHVLYPRPYPKTRSRGGATRGGSRRRGPTTSASSRKRRPRRGSPSARRPCGDFGRGSPPLPPRLPPRPPRTRKPRENEAAEPTRLTTRTSLEREGGTLREVI